jgi:hypothetical protein
MEDIKEGATWHADQLLGKDGEIRNYTTAITKQQPVTSNRGMMK